MGFDVVYGDPPPLHKKFFLDGPPFYPKLIGMITLPPPPQLQHKKKEKMQNYYLSLLFFFLMKSSIWYALLWFFAF